MLPITNTIHKNGIIRTAKSFPKEVTMARASALLTRASYWMQVFNSPLATRNSMAASLIHSSNSMDRQLGRTLSAIAHLSTADLAKFKRNFIIYTMLTGASMKIIAKRYPAYTPISYTNQSGSMSATQVNTLVARVPQ